MMAGQAVSRAIGCFTPRLVSTEAARFAREVTAAAVPGSVDRARAFLFAASRLGAFAESVGLGLDAETLLSPSVIERCCLKETATRAATRRTLRSNLRAIARALRPEAPVPALPRERSKAPYSRAEIAAYLGLADAQPTEARRHRGAALVCLGAGAGLVGADLRAVAGSDVRQRSGGVVVTVAAGRRPRVVPVLSRHHERLVAAARWAGDRLLIGGTSTTRRNVTTSLTASLTGGRGLARLETARLRATWLVEVASAIGLEVFMEAAGITCSQRLGDLVGNLDLPDEATAVALLGGRR